MFGGQHSPDLSQLRMPSVARSVDARASRVPSACHFLVAPAATILALGCGVTLLTGLGPMSRPMALHIAAMSVAAPMCAFAMLSILGDGRAPLRHDGTQVWTATLLQLVLLWAWHVPVAQTWAMSSNVTAAGMHLSLFLAALWFWWTLAAAARQWQPIFALLVTGKLACLLGALLIFAPRVLCAAPAGAVEADAPLLLTLADQQLAGLLMISACSLSYVLAAVVLAAQMMETLARTGRGSHATPR